MRIEYQILQKRFVIYIEESFQCWMTDYSQSNIRGLLNLLLNTAL